MNINVAIWTRVSLNKKNEKSNVFIHKMNFVYKNEKKIFNLFYLLCRNDKRLFVILLLLLLLLLLLFSGIDDNFVP